MLEQCAACSCVAVLLQVLLPALCASIRDEDAGPAVADCAALLGCHCSLQLLLELLEPRALDASAEAKKQADVLLVLGAVLRYAWNLFVETCMAAHGCGRLGL